MDANETKRSAELKTVPGFQERKRELVVRPRFYNGRPFAGFVTYLEAKHNLYKEAMGMGTNNLHGIAFIRDAQDRLAIVFNLKTEIERSELQTNYGYYRTNRAGDQDWIECDVDCPGLEPRLPSKEAILSESNYKTVKLEGCNYQLKEDEVREWLGLYGNIMGPIQEETFVDDEQDGADNGNGNYTVKMRLNREMPNVIPMFDQ